jgi:tetratricopeptide (TPR) repeat protein
MYSFNLIIKSYKLPRWIFHAFGALFIGLFLATCVPESQHFDYLIEDVQIVNVAKGKIKAHQYVGILDDRIALIASKPIRVDQSTIRVEGSNKFLIPGLWDMHGHYTWNYEDTTPLLIANGVIGVREMWGDMATIRQIRKQNEAGEIITPEIISSGAIIDGDPPAWSGSAVVRNAEEVKREIQQQIEQGVDFLKVYSLLSRETYFQIASEAKQKAIPFAGHIPEVINAFEAVEAEQQSIEHMINILESCVKDSAEYLSLVETYGMRSQEVRQFTIDTFDENTFQQLNQQLAQSDSWLCPTLTVLKAFSYLNDSTFTRDQRMEYLPSYISSGWRTAGGRSEAYWQTMRDRFEFYQQIIGQMQDAGVKFLAGTDFPNPFCLPGFGIHDELELLVESGFSPQEALASATINPAIFLNKTDDYGEIDTGKIASLVLLNDNPLEAIQNTQKIEAVFLKGKYFKKLQLESLLNKAALMAQRIAISEWFYPMIEQYGINEAIQQFKALTEGELSQYDCRAINFEAMGYEFLDEQNVKSAIAMFQLFTELYPENYIAFDGLAQAYLLAGNKTQALEYFQKALEINPDHQSAQAKIDELVAK